MHPFPSRGLAPLLLVSLFLIGCGGGGSPSSITFTSTPILSAVEGVPYSYQLAARSSDSSAIVFELSSGPLGSQVAGDMISWIPTHAESRISNSFTVMASTPSGASATQSWSVTPNGTVNITAVTTYWTPSGSTNVVPQWSASPLSPSIFVPQPDGSLRNIQGAANPDGSFSIPNVPAGSYWLQMNPTTSYWTATSDFDYGSDVVGRQLVTTSQNTTTFDFSIGGLDPPSVSGDAVSVLTDVQASNSLMEVLFGIAPGDTAANFVYLAPSDLDWSNVTTLYLMDYKTTNFGRISGIVLGPAETLTNVNILTGGTNSITASLVPSPSESLRLNVSGTSWASLASSTGPSAPIAVMSSYAAIVQPYVGDRYALPTAELQFPSELYLFYPQPAPYYCNISTQPDTFSLVSLGLPSITTDENLGTVAYGDPFPSTWPRFFQYCQISALNIPRPNSSAVDTFLATIRQTTTLPSGPVTPILTPVQNPMMNGSSLFESSNLSSTVVNITWSTPSSGTPFGYYVSVFQLTNLPSGTGYLLAGRYGTSQTSVSIPFLAAGNTYVFTITANVDGGSVIDKSPLRSKIPIAEAGVVSAPFVTLPANGSAGALNLH